MDEIKQVVAPDNCEITESLDDKYIRYEESIFTSITDDNYSEVVHDFCTAITKYNMSDVGLSDLGISYDYFVELEKMLLSLPRPYTIIQETYHIDRSYRDTYYAFYSNQHFDVKRYSRRLSFFKGIITEKEFFSYEEDGQDGLSKNVMGSCVINPLSSGMIGRTLINPQYLLPDADLPIHVRLSDFKLHIYGKKVFVKAFPFRMQDGVTMRCAEVTLLNLLEYYSNSFHDYRNVLPSEILDNEQKHNHERVLPAKGISYPILTKILSDLGFSPKLYDLSSVKKYSLSKVTQDDEFKRTFHYYIESGIPVAVNLSPVEENNPGHSIVCIGHGNPKPELMRKAKKNKWVTWRKKDSCHPIIDSADFYDEYVVIDDNQPVYQIRNFNQLSLYPEMKVENIAVPLYKRMYLDAQDASAIVKAVLHDDNLGIDMWTEGFLKHGEDVIMRLFMTSSHSLKNFRTKTLKDTYAREAYSIVPMPRFVWVCELYRECDYGTKAFGEIVIDATSVQGRNDTTRSLIIMRYPNVMGVRYPDQIETAFDEMLEIDDDELFPGFGKNLTTIKSFGTRD